MYDRRLTPTTDDETAGLGRRRAAALRASPPTDLRASKLTSMPVLAPPGGVAAAKLTSMPVLAPPGGAAVAKLTSMPVLAPPGGVAISKLVSYVVLMDAAPPSPPLPGFLTWQKRVIRADDSGDWQPVRPAYLRPALHWPAPPPPFAGVSVAFCVRTECCCPYMVQADPGSLRVMPDPVALCVPREPWTFRVHAPRKRC